MKLDSRSFLREAGVSLALVHTGSMGWNRGTARRRGARRRRTACGICTPMRACTLPNLLRRGRAGTTGPTPTWRSYELHAKIHRHLRAGAIRRWAQPRFDRKLHDRGPTRRSREGLRNSHPLDRFAAGPQGVKRVPQNGPVLRWCSLSGTRSGAIGRRMNPRACSRGLFMEGGQRR